MSRRICSFLVPILVQRWPLTIVAVVLALIASALESVSVFLTLPLLQLLTGDANAVDLIGSKLLESFLSVFTQISDSWRLPAILLTLLGVTIIKNVARYFANLSINKVQLQTGFSLRQQCIHRFLELDLLYYSQSKTGELLSTINEQVQRSERMASSVLEMATEIFTIGALVLLLVSLSPLLTVAAAFGLILVAVLLKPILTAVHRYGRVAALAIESFSSIIDEVLVGMRVIKSFNSELREANRAEKALRQRYEAELTALKLNSAIAPVTETFGIFVLLVLLGAGAMFFSGSSSLLLPMLLTYTLALLRILPRVSHFNGLRSQLSMMSGSFESVQQFLLNTAGRQLPDGNKPFTRLEHEIVFDQVGFAFPGNDVTTLNQITFELLRGTTTALIGPSGSGKSTLADLLMRFHDPSSGRIMVDGVDLRTIQLETWRRAVAMVSQDTFLFNISIRDNIAYGVPDATEAQIIVAAKKAYAYEFIQQLPQKFDTIVGNRGTKLSGGERQRIAIARAFLRDPDILILDEATSALDTSSERIVQQAVEEISRNRTVLVIAHRLSTIENANKVIVLQDGEIIEQRYHVGTAN